METLNIIEKRRKEEKDFIEEYNKKTLLVKKIIKEKLNNKEFYFVFDYLEKYLFSKKSKEIDLNPQMLAFNQGKQTIYNSLLSLLDNELIINYMNYKNGTN